jgi:UDP-2,3-diacylglucosamine hydrolase
MSTRRLPMPGAVPYTARVPPITLVVSDAHLGFAASEVESAFHRFLDHVPDVAEHLVINGDLFEFWFEYRSVIARAAFPTLEALARVRRAGVHLTVVGGNHDRWGGAFWREQLGAAFHADGTDLTIGGLPTAMHHGDGLAGDRLGARLFRTVVRNPATTALFRLLHPDLGYGLVRRLSPHLGGKAEDPAVREAATDRQVAYARSVVRARPEVRLVVLSHTHVARVEPLGEGRWFLNPGAWMDGLRYARVGPDGPTLERFEE